MDGQPPIFRNRIANPTQIVLKYIYMVNGEAVKACAPRATATTRALIADLLASQWTVFCAKWSFLQWSIDALDTSASVSIVATVVQPL